MKTYYFIFSKTDLLLQRLPDGKYTIPCTEETPVKTHAWIHIMEVSPMENGTLVKTLMLEDPQHVEITDLELRFIIFPPSSISRQANVRSSSTGTTTPSSVASVALR